MFATTRCKGTKRCLEYDEKAVKRRRCVTDNTEHLSIRGYKRNRDQMFADTPRQFIDMDEVHIIVAAAVSRHRERIKQLEEELKLLKQALRPSIVPSYIN